MEDFDDLEALIARKDAERKARLQALQKPHWLRHRKKYLCALALCIAGLYTNSAVLESAFGKKAPYKVSQYIPVWSCRPYKDSSIISFSYGDSRKSVFYRDSSFHKIPEQENSPLARIPLPTDFVGEMAEEDAVKNCEREKK